MPARLTPRSPQPHRYGRRRVRRRPAGAVTALLALAVAFAALILPAAPASAADSYRFWGFFQQDAGKWAFATKGADQIVPADGAVDGWRLSVGDMTVTHAPRAALTFDTICAATPAQSGKKRVGVVLDFGRPADNETGATVPQPRAQCAVVDAKATSAAVLAAVAPVRAEKGMVCAVENTPAGGCGVKVANPPAEAKAADTPIDIPVVAAGTPASPPATGTPTDSASPSPGASTSAPAPASSGGPTPTAVLLVLLVLVAAALATWLSMRRRAAARRSTTDDVTRR